MALEGQVALVFGGASGIGLATAQELLRAGANVAVGDVAAAAAGEAAAQQLQAQFGAARAVFVRVDVRDDEQVEAAFSSTKQHFKKLDIFVNSAGIAENRNWKLTADVHIMGAIRGTMLAWKHMGKHEGGAGGVVVNVASIMGLNVVACAPIYCAAKHAMVGLGRSCGMPYHLQRTGVRVITMCPGFTMTPMCEPGENRFLSPELAEEATKETASVIFQKVENVAKGILHVIEHGASGSVWVCENDEPTFEVAVPGYRNIRVTS